MQCGTRGYNIYGYTLWYKAVFWCMEHFNYRSSKSQPYSCIFFKFSLHQSVFFDFPFGTKGSKSVIMMTLSSFISLIKLLMTNCCYNKLCLAMKHTYTPYHHYDNARYLCASLVFLFCCLVIMTDSAIQKQWQSHWRRSKK